MTGEGLAAVVTSLATLVGVMGGIWIQLRGQTEARAERASMRNKIDDTAAKVDQVHLATNSLTDKLVASTSTIAHRDGVDAGIAQEAARALASGPQPVTIQNIAPIPVVVSKDSP